MSPADKFKSLCTLTTELLGLPKGSLSNKSRKHKYQAARSAVSCVARKVDFIHEKIIAKELNRDRTTVYHYDRTHDANFDTWELYRETFDKIYNAYTEIENQKKTFADLHHLQRWLKNHGVKHSSVHEKCVRIKSVDLVLDIVLSYKDFHCQLDLINLALRNHKHTTEIR